MRNHLGVLGFAAVLVISGCAATLGPGSVVLIGNEGSVCIPSLEGMRMQLGGVAIDHVVDGVAAQGVEFLKQENTTISGAYLTPLNGGYDLVGFDLVGDEWEAHIPAGSILLGDDPMPLEEGQRYALVVVMAAVDQDRPAKVSGIALRYSEAGRNHIGSVIDEAVLPALGAPC